MKLKNIFMILVFIFTLNNIFAVEWLIEQPTAYFPLTQDESIKTQYNATGIFENESNGFMDFDGIDDYGLAPSISQNVNGFSMTTSIWINTTDVTANNRFYVQLEDPGTGAFSCGIGDSGQEGKMRFFYNANETDTNSFSTATYNDGDWHLFTCVLNGSNSKGYVDGVNVINATLSGGFTATEIEVGFHGTPSLGLDAQADEVQILNKSLTQSEIQTMYNNGRQDNRPTLDIIYYNSLSGLTDFSQNNNSGIGLEVEINSTQTSLDGINDNINIGDIEDTFTEITICSFFKTTITDQFMAIYSHPHSSNTGAVGLSVINTKLRGNINTQGGGSIQIDSEQNVSDNIWHHGCFVWNQTTGMNLYLNGININSSLNDGFTDDVLNPNLPAKIGLHKTNERIFEGEIRQVVVFNETLSDEEILQLYNNSGNPIQDMNFEFEDILINRYYNTENISISLNVINNQSGVNVSYSLFNSSNDLVRNETKIPQKTFENPTRITYPVINQGISLTRFCYEEGFNGYIEPNSTTFTNGRVAIWSVTQLEWGFQEPGTYVNSLTCTNELPLTFQINSLEDDEYKLSFFATDGTQNASTGNFTFTVDTVDPVINITFFENVTEPIEVNQYELFLFEFLNISIIDLNPNFTKYFYKGQEIPEILLTSIEDRPITGIGSYTGTSYDLSSEDTDSHGIFFNDGFWYRIGNINNEIFQYYPNWTYTGTSFDISGEDTTFHDLYFHNGSWYLTGDQNDAIFQYYENWTYTGTSYDVSGQDTSPRGLFFNNGTWNVVGDLNNAIFQYYENWTYTGTSFDISAQDTAPHGIFFIDDFWYLSGNLNNDIFQYNQSWDYTGTSVDVSTQTASPLDIFIKDQFLYLMGNTINNVFSYNTIFNDSTFRFDEAGNNSITIVVQDNATNNISQELQFFVDPYQYFRFNDSGDQLITNFTFGGTFFEEEEARIKLSQIGFGNQTLTFEKLGYNTTNLSLEFTNTSEYNLTIQIPFATIQVNIFDRETGDLITPGTTNIELFGEAGFTGSTTTGQITIQNTVFVQGSYGIIATNTGYAAETIYFDFTNQQNIELNIYMLEESASDFGNIVVIAQNKFGELIQGAICTANEWKADQSAYVPVASGKTNALGKIILNVELGTTLYKFSCTKDGITTTNEERIIQLDFDEEIVIIDLEAEEIETDFENVRTNVTQNIIGDFAQINYDFENTLGDNVVACIKYFQVNGNYKSLINETCVNQPSGTIIELINTSNSFDLQILATIEIQGTEYNVRSFFHPSTANLIQYLAQLGLDKFIMVLFIILAVTVVFITKIPLVGEFLGIILVWVGVKLTPESVWNSRLAFTCTVIFILMMYWGYKAK